jgi:pimeloyl-ACP methyl ester carboxylesterase
VDRRGRGDSEDGSGAYTLESEFEDVAAVVADVGDGALLFGHSYGALVAAGAAGRIEGLPALVLYEPPMGGVLADPETTDRWESLVAAGDRETPVSEFLHTIGGYTHEEIDQLRPTPAWELRKEAFHTVPRELRAETKLNLESLNLDELELPVAMLVGSESPDWARRSTDAYAQALPRAAVQRLEGHGHGGLLSGPELVADRLTESFGRSG